MERVLVKITDPIRWSERIQWIKENSTNGYEDITIWPAWSIGLTDIEILLSEKDAVFYYLAWP